MDWLIGFLGSTAIASLAYWKRSLSESGMIAAILAGTILFAVGSIAWYGTLLAFFISSTLLSKWKQMKKASIEEGYEKTGRRDAGQVAANGGLAVLLVTGNSLYLHPIWWIAFVGVMAGVNADTWATEIGSLSRQQPRSILTGKPVVKGTSGGISSLGLAASIAGGLFIGLSAWVFTRTIGTESHFTFIQLVLTGGIAGTIGSIVDSYIGARWQVMYQCKVCKKEVERRIHCHQPTSSIRGFNWMNNDAVNLISSLVSAGVAVLLFITT